MMVESAKKSTEAIREVIFSEDGEGDIFLDSRLALHHSARNWLAVGDLHYGYEISRRANGGLWPLWGRESVQTRLDSLISDYHPELLILNGDIVDSAAAGKKEALDWLMTVKKRVAKLILIRGNHDRGLIVREMEFVNDFQIGKFHFHHGHRAIDPESEKIEIVGHHHPAVRFADGAGLSMKIPALIQESHRWIMPAFSPWAGGGRFQSDDEMVQWACSPRRIFRV